MSMIVSFRRTGSRRYAIEVRRRDHPDVEMNPAPGYDALVPHDMLHMIVEAELRLHRGVFGQLATGGHAGTFHFRGQPGESKRDGARLRRRSNRRGARLLRAGRTDASQSERAAYIAWYEWLARASSSSRRNRALPMAVNARKTRDEMPVAEQRALSARMVHI